MAKRIVGYTPMGDGTKDRGEEICVFEFFDNYFEEIETNAFGIKKRTIQTFHSGDIVYIDCFKGSELRNESASGALAGGVLFGLPGAIIGGILGLNQSAWYCKIAFVDKILFFRLYKNEIDKDFVMKWAGKNNVQTRFTEDVAKILGFNDGKELDDLKKSVVEELGDPLDVPVDIDIVEVNQRLAKLGALATSEFYRLKKNTDCFTKADVLRLEAMEQSDLYKE